MNYQPRNDLLAKHTILVTGATDGIGREAAHTYARYGAKLVLLGRNPQKLATVQQEIAAFSEIPAETFVLDFDTATPADCQTLAAQIAETNPVLDGVLHNAGVLGAIMPLAELPTDTWQQVMRVNLDVTFYLTQALLPLLEKSPHGSLVFTTSSVGRVGRAGWGAYAVSKFATEGMMQVFAEEYAESSLRINCINPGGTRTGMRASAYPEEDSNKLKTPADIMPIYLWLMGEDSRNESGQSFDAQPNRKAGPVS